MISWSDRVPGYLLGKEQLISTVNFALFFSVVFTLLSIPFSHNAWFQLGASEAFAYTVAFFFLSFALVSLSKWLMYRFRTFVEKRFGRYLAWNLLEIILICALYTLFTRIADRVGLIDLDGASLLPVFLNALLYAVVSLGIPYILAGMYLALNDKDNTIRLMNYGSVVSDEPISPQMEQKITLFDNSGALKLSINSSNLYYIESDDNYIKVWYADAKGMLKQYMLRCRLKTVEESFLDSDLVRCHRKYIVNMLHVKVLTRQKEGYVVELDLEDSDPIPVTKTYEENVLRRFNSR
ncbi:MAG: LytTR family transcriptional regulator [Bacteroidales bacterium]|nr:LytTR family transcriptional regulator [Bacteroidales bacterium]